MIWLAALAGVVLAVLAARKIAALLKPLPEGKRRCPHCGHEFEGERRYCLGCGGQIWDDVLSED